MKAIHVRLYNLQQDQRPEISNYVIPWEDIPRNDEEDWNTFQSLGDAYLEFSCMLLSWFGLPVLLVF